ncbi:MAG: hypothetical protein DWH98_05850 [Planctomycetota bacterium]|nr:DUF5522 domain-containing protein [Planctomycetia bacterium]RLS64552.1 MAG: hypothetical protein DWH98_05850 [Planctomycetota bacterium]
MNSATPPTADGPDHGPEYDWENGLLVFTAAYHLKRGSCCGSGCRNCPYEPKHTAGSCTPNEFCKGITVRTAIGQ